MPKLKLFPSDVVWSKYIRTRDNWTCQRCSKKYTPPTSALHCSHFWSRGSWSVRFDEENTMALCYGCHSYLGGNPQEHREFVLNRLGQKKYDALQRRRNSGLFIKFRCYPSKRPAPWPWPALREIGAKHKVSRCGHPILHKVTYSQSPGQIMVQEARRVKGRLIAERGATEFILSYKDGVLINKEQIKMEPIISSHELTKEKLPAIVEEFTSGKFCHCYPIVAFAPAA